jgi:NitT/TauT family transport system substrate-binding protein
MKRAHVLAGLGAAAAGTALPALAQDASGAALTVSMTPVDSSAEPYFAVDAGFAKAAGLNIELVASQNGAAIANAVASGAVDIGNGNLVSVALAHAKGIPFVLIAPGGLYSAKTPSTQFFVPKGSTARTGRDFTGKTVAINTLRGLPQYGTQEWIDKTGGRSETVKFIEMSSADILVALQQNRVDGAALVEPFVSSGRTAGTPIAAIFDAIAPAFLITAHFTTLEWARAHPDLVRRFQDTIAKTAAWANKNHDRSGEILVKYAKLNDETMHTMLRTVFAERLDIAQIQPVVDLTVKYGGITAFPAEQLVFRPS